MLWAPYSCVCNLFEAFPQFVFWNSPLHFLLFRDWYMLFLFLLVFFFSGFDFYVMFQPVICLSLFWCMKWDWNVYLVFQLSNCFSVLYEITFIFLSVSILTNGKYKHCKCKPGVRSQLPHTITPPSSASMCLSWSKSLYHRVIVRGKWNNISKVYGT